MAPERFAVLQALLAYLLAACGEDKEAQIPAAELLERFPSVPAEELEEHLSLLNLVNFGGGCYTIYTELRAAREIRLLDHFGAALRVREDHHVRELLADVVDVLGREQFSEFAAALPRDHRMLDLGARRGADLRQHRGHDHVQAGLARDVAGEVFVGQENHRVGLQ